MFCVLQTDNFYIQAKHLGLSEAEVHKIVDALSKDPTIGDLIPGTGGARKWRVAAGHKGKSGGYRVVSYFGGDDIPVFFAGYFC